VLDRAPDKVVLRIRRRDPVLEPAVSQAVDN
jgi:hypothetical protein